MSADDLRSAVSALVEATAALTGAGSGVWGLLSAREREDLYGQCQRARNSMILMDADFLRAHEDDLPVSVARRANYLARAFHLTVPEAKARVDAASRVHDAPVRRDGRPDRRHMPALRDACRDGAVGADSVAAVHRAIDRLPRTLHARLTEACDVPLADLARSHGPAAFHGLGPRLRALCDIDDPYTDEDRARRRTLSLGKQGFDGMSRLSGLVTPELAAMLRRVLCDLGNSGDLLPETAVDRRTPGQRYHDALAAALASSYSPPVPAGQDPATTSHPTTDTSAPQDPTTTAPQDPCSDGRCGVCPSCNPRPDAECLPVFPGTPVRPRRGTTTIVAVTTLEELLARSGTGITDTGDRMTVGSLIESALATDLYLQVLDFQGRSLWLGRSRRLGSLDQYLALLGEEGMSTAPGSSACAAKCAMHHIDGWNHGGDTDIDNLTFTDTSTHARVDDTRTNPNRWFTLRADSAGGRTSPPPAHPRTGAPDDRAGDRSPAHPADRLDHAPVTVHGDLPGDTEPPGGISPEPPTTESPTPPSGDACPYPVHEDASACPRHEDICPSTRHEDPCPSTRQKNTSAGPHTREEKVTWVPPRTVDPHRRPRVNPHPDMWDHPASRLRRTGSLHRGGTGEHPAAPTPRCDTGQCDTGDCDARDCDTRD
ncbi:HNH endonuclease [Corynebacterium bovis]|uniref:HNH endonuclease signature motif containing protein n=1 Tax=Corynebacterium bovis TaxID=36808 RepID=UPI0031396799